MHLPTYEPVCPSFNPQRTCAVRVKVLGLCVCVCVCVCVSVCAEGLYFSAFHYVNQPLDARGYLLK